MPSFEERIFLVEHVFRSNDKYTEAVKQKFREQFPESTVPNRDTVRDLIDKFRRTGSVLDEDRSGRPSVTSPEKKEEISDALLRSPSKSIRRLAQQTAVSKSTAHRIVRNELKLYPYRIKVVHQLKKSTMQKGLDIANGFRIWSNQKDKMF